MLCSIINYLFLQSFGLVNSCILAYMLVVGCCVMYAHHLSNGLQRVSRPRGGINEKLRWLPVYVHKQLEGAVEWIRGKPFRAHKLVPFSSEQRGVVG